MSLLRYLVIVISFGSQLHHSAVYADGARTFVIAAHEWPPFASHEAKYFGVAPRAVSDILQNQDIEVKYRFMPWSDALDGVIAKEFDGAIVWVTEDLHRESFLISDPILEHQTVLYYRKNTPTPKAANSLIGYRLGINPHYVYDLTSYRLIKSQRIKTLENESDSEQIRNLLEGKIDFYLTPILTNTPLRRNSLSQNEQNALTYSTNLFKFPSPHLVVSRHREGSAEFMNKFNQHLKRMQTDGTVERYISDFRFTDY